ncbi:hypothetical protein [Deefgea sp. CFH1-16]|nr:hypothetical protein [Deefgea sp. CFH1-16]
MFARRSDASKIAFVHAVQWLAAAGFVMIDCQMHTEHLARFGAREIARDEFIAKLEVQLVQPDLLGPWSYSHTN